MYILLYKLLIIFRDILYPTAAAAAESHQYRSTCEPGWIGFLVLLKDKHIDLFMRLVNLLLTERTVDKIVAPCRPLLVGLKPPSPRR